jgi:hypothetical protein
MRTICASSSSSETDVTEALMVDGWSAGDEDLERAEHEELLSASAARPSGDDAAEFVDGRWMCLRSASWCALSAMIPSAQSMRMMRRTSRRSRALLDRG